MASRLGGALVWASLAAAIATRCGDDDSLGGSAARSGALLEPLSGVWLTTIEGE
jgi:hypothetical protein